MRICHPALSHQTTFIMYSDKEQPGNFQTTQLNSENLFRPPLARRAGLIYSQMLRAVAASFKLVKNAALVIKSGKHIAHIHDQSEREKIFRLTELADNAFGNISYGGAVGVRAGTKAHRRRINNRLGRQRSSRNHKRVYRARLISLSPSTSTLALGPCGQVPFQTHIALITAALPTYDLGRFASQVK
jgi:hypothetical protein